MTDTLQPPPKASFIYPTNPEGAVHIGAPDALGLGWEPVMLHRQASEEIRALFVMLDKVAAFLGNASRLQGTAWDAAAAELARDLSETKAKLATASGGTASAGLVGRAARGL